MTARDYTKQCQFNCVLKPNLNYSIIRSEVHIIGEHAKPCFKVADKLPGYINWPINQSCNLIFKHPLNYKYTIAKHNLQHTAHAYQNFNIAYID